MGLTFFWAESAQIGQSYNNLLPIKKLDLTQIDSNLTIEILVWSYFYTFDWSINQCENPHMYSHGQKFGLKFIWRITMCLKTC